MYNKMIILKRHYVLYKILLNTLKKKYKKIIIPATSLIFNF